MDEDLGSIQERTFDTATAATAGSYPAQRRLGPGQLAAYLDSRAFAVVSFARPSIGGSGSEGAQEGRK
jgi:hypothetical protein